MNWPDYIAKVEIIRGFLVTLLIVIILVGIGFFIGWLL